MGLLTHLTGACLRAAARRWPADLRDDVAREWAAELGALERQGGTGWRRVTFAVSLAVTPLSSDENGAPRGGWEWMRAGLTLRSASRLLVAGGFGLGIAITVAMAIGNLIDYGAYPDDTAWLLVRTLMSAVTAALMTGYAVVAGRWAGARAAREPGPAGSLGLAATAVVPFTVLLPFFLAVRTEPVPSLVLLVTALWTMVSLALVAVTVRAAATGRRTRTRVLTWAGVPLVAVLSGVPLPVGGGSGVPADQVARLAEVACFVLPWTVCAVVFARTAVRRWSAPVAAVAPQPGSRASYPVRGVPAWRHLTPQRVLLSALAAVAAAVWAVGVTVWQPLSEPAHVADATGENNTYWARELRWGALVAVVLLLVVYVRGDRRATRGVLLGGAAWLAIDIQLDRIDPASGTVALAITAAVAAIAACAAAGAVAAVPRPQVLLTVATVAGVMSFLATATESPTDVEPQLNLGSAIVGSLLAAVAVAAAVGAAGSVSRTRAVAGLAAGVAAAAVPSLLRLRYPQPSDVRLYAILLFAAVLLLTVVVLAGPRPRAARQWLRYPFAFVVGAVTVPLMLFPLVVMAIALPVGRLFTALAGNPPIHGADTDAVTVLLAVPIGWALGRLLRNAAFGRRLFPQAPRPIGPAPVPVLVPPDRAS
ncbi:hypothetical protein [Jidongwangia harbinensis]|uniref:hypothetical protein n=1 Tax=Jidongwangia harbinensis TaxID=2878561 RepID=UPI001CD9FF31|nr:hypothetical protein [Jidongwangia harbinensis]MCA2219084.1 hypothetical protein [Jidongwangia harbinensis]